MSHEARSKADDRLVRRVFAPFAVGYWQGTTARQAWTLTLILGTAVLLGIATGVVFSLWNRWFFDALEQKDGAELGWSLLALLGIVVFGTAFEVALVLSRETVQVRWRAWFSDKLIERWLGRQRFHHMNGAGDDKATVPEYRIADDIRWATEPIMDFYIGLVAAVVSVASFVGILWVVGGAMTLAIGGTTITIPGYMAVAGVIHAAILMVSMLYVGRALPRNIAARNEAEANFRLSLMRVRENADSVALAHGEAGERAILRRALDTVARRWLVVVGQNGRLTWILRSNNILLPVIPLLFASPKYLSGELSLGAVMQLVSAYLPFQTSVAWAVHNYQPLSNWHAAARRVAGLIQSMDELDDDLDRSDRSAITTAASDDGCIHVVDLTVTDRHGGILVRNADLVVRPGEKLLLTGDSGTGKSALVRTIAGLAPWGSGTIRRPPGARVSVVPQRAHLPLGSLRDALRYPFEQLEADDGAIVEVLVRYGIGRLAPRLDTVERWDQLLSNSERQRLAFVRLFLQRPTIVVLDDALAAFGDGDRVDIMSLLRRDLADSAVLNVAPHGGLERFHDRTLRLVKGEIGARLDVVEPARLVQLRPGE